MPKQMIILTFNGDRNQKKDLEQAFLTLLKQAAIEDIKTLAAAIEKNPGLIKQAVKIVG